MLQLVAVALLGFLAAAHRQKHTVHHFIDGALLKARSDELQVVLGPVAKRGAVLPEAAAWESGFSNSYPSVYHDEGAYKLYYNSYLGQGRLESPTGAGLSQRNVHWHWNQTKTQGGAGLRPLIAPATCNSWGGVLQATSPDGFNFSRPALHDLLANGSLASLGSSPTPLARNTNVAVVSCNAPGRTLYIDANPRTPAAQRYKMVGCFSNNGWADSGFFNGGKDLKAMYSTDGISFSPAQTLQSADVPWLMAHDGLANIVFDSTVDRYMIFMRTYDLNKSAKLQARRVSRMVSKSSTWGGQGTWEERKEVLRGERGYEIYELRPWRLPSWRPGLYFGIGMYYADAETTGKVFSELLMSTNFGANWTRLAPHKTFIPHGAGNAFDNSTIYAATPFSADGGRTLLYYYSGGNGPHNGVRTSAGIVVRDDTIARAEGRADAIAGFQASDNDEAGRGGGVWSSVLTHAVDVIDSTLWLALGTTLPIVADSGIYHPHVTVELQRNGIAVDGFGAQASSLRVITRSPSSASDNGEGTGISISRMEIRWGAQANMTVAALVGQQVELAIVFRSCTLYSFGFSN
jgi:hypothetical protein